jgi:DNA-directed RNA polymerase specialized sigma24 family protein
MTKPKTNARAAARARAAEALAERRRRDQANAAALEAYFAADHAEAQIHADLQAEIDKARQRAAQAKREALRALQGNGETINTIAALAGIAARDVRQLLHDGQGKQTS